jgi:alcohol dehydrogenase
MKTTGAILEVMSAERPYATSRPVAVREVELDEPGPHEVLIRVEAAGVCHSDLSVVSGVRPRPLPMLLGHEAAGIVQERGSLVDNVDVGDRVIMTFLPRCGECEACATDGKIPCSEGGAANAEGRLLDGGRRLHDESGSIHHHLGVSGFATYAVVDYRSVVKVGPDVPADVAALMGCAVLTGGGAVRNAGRLSKGETLVVVGLGGVGMAALLVGLAHDDVTVIGVDAADHKLETALALGAHQALMPQEAIDAGIRGDLVVEAVGRVQAFESAIDLTAIGGRTVMVGLPSPSEFATVSPVRLVAEGRSIIGSYLGNCVPARDLAIFIDMWRAGRLPVERLISARLEIGQINEAFDSLERGDALRQIIEFSQESASTGRSVGEQ